ncbi:MAG TPA: NAD(+) synthase [Candidatus Coprovivens excrementavium]|nr:NAD(+) synthase [Candidatus Coprovivens excrementavium]
MNKKFGYVRVAASVPELKVANVEFNTKEVIKEIKALDKEGVQIVTFPELCLTGYTCADLFSQDILITKSKEAIKEVIDSTKLLDIISIIGAPIVCDNQLFNCGVVINKGKILGIVPKTYIPNYGEFYEKRWFSTSNTLTSKTINLFGKEVPIGIDLVFRDINDSKFAFGIEICEDLWSPKAPSVEAALNGATMIFNLSASNEVIGKAQYRRNLINMQSAKNVCAYIYSSSGVNESSTDLVFSGYAGISENGSMLVENERFNFKTNHIISDVDIQRLMNNRIKDISFMGIGAINSYRVIDIDLKDNNNDLKRMYDAYPFVPSNEDKRAERCSEIINIQACGLAKRIKHTGMKKCVIGISGGLDSTLAFLVIIEAYRKLGISFDNLIGVTMPGFGTTGRTYNNALTLMKNYGVTMREVSIKEASLQHFKDIGLEETDRSVTYENTQARERTQILMDIANKEGGLVIGTGDLSELALGWCTYNGDHMSMYAVNTSIPKTLVRYLVKYFADIEQNEECKKTILDILDTPISPELLPPSKDGKIEQQTESVVGPYILHDFFLYHFMRYGASPDKIKYIASKTFDGMYDEETIDKWLKFFIKRFFNQQFKRSCLPDGPKVGTISVSPRGDLRMPSDADSSIWLEY